MTQNYWRNPFAPASDSKTQYEKALAPIGRGMKRRVSR